MLQRMSVPVLYLLIIGWYTPPSLASEHEYAVSIFCMFYFLKIYPFGIHPNSIDSRRVMEYEIALGFH